MNKIKILALLAGVSALGFFLFIAAPAGAYPLGNVASYSSAANPQELVVADFNNDGRLDFAVVDYGANRISVFLSNGYGTFAPATEYGVSTSPWGIAAADFNGDGYKDLVVSNSGDNRMSYLQNNGNGTFAAAVNYGTGSSPRVMAVGDFNGDNKKDVAVANMSAGTVSVLLGNGDGTFNPKVDYAVGSYPAAVVVNDFNGDNKQDLAVANSCAGCFVPYNSGSVSVLTGVGDGTFNAAQNFNTTKGAVAIATGDFNADGKQDVVVVKRTANQAGILLGNGDGTLQPIVNYAAGSLPMGLATGDFNADGKLDLVSANSSDNTLSFLTGIGDGTFATQTTSSADVNPWSVATGDFNADGKLDLVESNRGANNVGLFLDTSLPSISGLSPSSSYAGSAATDVTISGAGFEPDSTVEVGGNTYATTFTNTSQVKIQMSAADLASVGEKGFQVYNPSIGDYSNTATFTIQAAPAAPVPQGGGLPSSAFVGPSAPAGGFKIIINGGAQSTVARNVVLKLVWQGASEPLATRFALANSPDFTNASLLDLARHNTDAYPWDLCAGAGGSYAPPDCASGPHTVYAKFYTGWGRSSAPVSAGINLNTPGMSGLTTAGINTASVSAGKFMRRLQFGSNGSDVKLLQQFLNGRGFTVAASGPGSAGHETAYFGLATKAALVKFQEAYAEQILTPQSLKSGTGVFGSASRATANSML